MASLSHHACVFFGASSLSFSSVPHDGISEVFLANEMHNETSGRQDVRASARLDVRTSGRLAVWQPKIDLATNSETPLQSLLVLLRQ